MNGIIYLLGEMYFIEKCLIILMSIIMKEG